MSTPSPAAQTPAPKPRPPALELIKEHVKPFLAPYYLTVAAVLGLMTVGFVAVIGLLVLVVANFNVLGLIE